MRKGLSYFVFNHVLCDAVSNVHSLFIEPVDEGEMELAADVRATCDRLRFTKLEILESASTADDEVSNP
jgi:hypothetical protein